MNHRLLDSESIRALYENGMAGPAKSYAKPWCSHTSSAFQKRHNERSTLSTREPSTEPRYRALATDGRRGFHTVCLPSPATNQSPANALLCSPCSSAKWSRLSTCCARP